MQNDLNRAMVEFNNSASKLFAMLFQKFENTIASVNRGQHDNTFQQLQGKFIYTFKMQMENMAQQLIEKNSSINEVDRLKKKLSGAIKDYLDEFLRKAKSL